ncbi:uncharacterized protein N7503_005998 [Penicillium pulvis]|uniref:uncharacterized protein n=1 Tax=Penicillium pulvis TaxID=1562058 RepID=UPI002548EEFB|nr:uncharacterized protein N7503_005998 [Penicillium pulvis]KAJ5803548.1 hypothetical protein N7503_005998 [Penicillium pulvis]
MSPKPPRSKNYPLLDDDELTILLDWQDLNKYKKIIHNNIARKAYSPEGRIELLLDGNFDQLTQNV